MPICSTIAACQNGSVMRCGRKSASTSSATIAPRRTGFRASAPRGARSAARAPLRTTSRWVSHTVMRP